MVVEAKKSRAGRAINKRREEEWEGGDGVGLGWAGSNPTPQVRGWPTGMRAGEDHGDLADASQWERGDADRGRGAQS